MNLSCVIIDDEPVARQIIREFVGRIGFLELRGEAEDPLSAEKLLVSGDVDLVFLDIEMPNMTGMRFLKLKPSPKFLTIITTAYPNHAVESFELNILDYLVKPIAFDRFALACTRAKEYLELRNGGKAEDYFFVKSEGKIEKINFDDLVYLESMGNYVTMHRTRGKTIVYVTLKSLLEQLKARDFLQVHKSYAVNISKVKSIEGNELTLETGKVPIGLKMKEEVMRVILGNKVIRRPER